MRALLLLLVASTAHADLAPRVATMLDEAEDDRSKKALWFEDKARVREPREPATAPVQPVSLRNMWTDEVLPLGPDTQARVAQVEFDHLARCHFTQSETMMAPRLLAIVRAAAARFHASVVEIVSGYRAPKYQLMLRKKGHEVARDSEHPRGEAVDFRLPNVTTKELLAFVRAQRAGGVGYYPVSKFVHADVGKVRFWRGH